MIPNEAQSSQCDVALSARVATVCPLALPAETIPAKVGSTDADSDEVSDREGSNDLAGVALRSEQMFWRT